MPSPRQSEMLKNIGESAPALVFVAFWQAGWGMDLAGWTASGVAAVVLAVFWIRKVSPDPICLGINLHILLITPVIVGMIAAGYAEMGQTLAAFAYPAVFATMFLTGLITILLGRSLVRGSSRATAFRGGNLALLALMVAGGIWAMTYEGAPLLQVALPVMGLFLTRRYLLARSADRSEGSHAVLISGSAGGFAAEPAA